MVSSWQDLNPIMSSARHWPRIPGTCRNRLFEQKTTRSFFSSGNQSGKSVSRLLERFRISRLSDSVLISSGTVVRSEERSSRVMPGRSPARSWSRISADIGSTHRSACRTLGKAKSPAPPPPAEAVRATLLRVSKPTFSPVPSPNLLQGLCRGAPGSG